jgi:metal-responsive CopG/Arc/MetJ family transcriptional regulator
MEPHRQGSKHRKVRTSVSLPADAYQELEELAERKKVSVAWVVREAVDRYLASEHPRLKNPS